ncbi:hypothetical protein NW765_017662 [Fusarium oxysporum]|nr:hypothetical protein NW765_017662 [Fusarium oxysporum]KAJ4257612.1 hypothetical protein NW764_016302 [Fusarium oxysporum]
MTADAPVTHEETSKQRNRRAAYTSVACDKCRQRKSKCSGGDPCNRCREHEITCSYPRTTRFRSARRNSTVARSVNSTAINADAVNPISQQRASAHEVSSDCSVASSAPLRPGNFDYYLRLVENNFGAASTDQTRKSPGKPAANLVGVEQIRQAIQHRALGSHGSALAAFDKETWIAVLQLWEEEVGLQYPLLDIQRLGYEIDAAKQEATCSEDYPQGSSHQPAADAALLILAILSSIKDASAIEVADPVVQEIHGVVLVQAHTGRIERRCLVQLILIAVYSFLVDREVLAWRTTGTVLRLLQELDSQSSQGKDPGIDDKLFWTVYTLDRRWGFGTGLPFAVSDSDITRKPKLEASNNDQPLAAEGMDSG